MTRAVFVLVLLSTGLDVGMAECTAGVGAATNLSQIQFLRSYRAYFNSPTRLTVDESGNLYTTDPKKGRLLVRRPDGKRTLDLAGLGFPLGIAVGAQGRIYLGDGRSGSVNIYDQNGDATGFLGLGQGEFLLPNDIEVHHATGEVFVADSLASVVKRYSSSGQLLQTIGGPGTGEAQFDFPTGIFIRNDELYVVDQRNSRVQVLSLTGTFLFCIDSKIPHRGGFSCDGWSCGTARRYDQDIWVDGAGRIYVSDAFDGAIHVMGRDGVITDTIGHFGDRSGQLKNPLSLAVDPFNRVFVASAGHGRIQMFGIGDFSDPERYVPGKLVVDPDVLDLDTASELVAYLELPGYRVDTIATGSITANGSAAPVSTAVGDHDRNGFPDLKLIFDRSLIDALPREPMATIAVTGEIAALKFEESAQIRLIGGVPPDDDQDGVPNVSDACPDTAIGDITGPDGCGLQQLCPCGSNDPGREQGSNDIYTGCIARETKTMVRSGTLTPAERTGILVQAGQSGCEAQP